MKEIKLNVGSLWGYITVIIITGILCGTAVFINMQINQTQLEIAKIQAKSAKESSNNIKGGLDNLSRGTCIGGGGTFCAAAVRE